MAEDRQSSWIGWVLAALLGTAVIAPQVGGEKPTGPSAAAPGPKVSHSAAESRGGSLAAEWETTTLRPLARFLDERNTPARFAPNEVTLRGEAQKPSWEVKGDPFANLDEVKTAWENAHGVTNSANQEHGDLLSQSPHLRLLVATLPDPEYPDLLPVHDLYLRAMKEQLHRQGWFFAGYWYPEMDQPGRAPEAFRLMPRSILFSRPLRSPGDWEKDSLSKLGLGAARGNHELLLVLLLPENPSRGIDRARLRAALHLVKLWQDTTTPNDPKGQQQRFRNAKAKAEQDGEAFQEWLKGCWNRVHSLDADKPIPVGAGDLWEVLTKQVDRLVDLPTPGQSWQPWQVELERFPNQVEAAVKDLNPNAEEAFSRIRIETRTEARSFTNRLWAHAAEGYNTRRSLRILGPYYSSSVQALAEELSHRVNSARLEEALIVSPTSTAPSVRGANHWPKGVNVCFLAPADGQDLSNTVRQNFKEALAGTSSVWATVKEADTVYGGVGVGVPWQPTKSTPHLGQELIYKLPSNLTALRHAKGGTEADPTASVGGPLRAILARLRPLALNWQGEDTSPELAPLERHPAANLDLEFQALVQDMKLRGVKAVYISMSSLENTLFIARQLRMHLPDLILATTWIHAEMSHPDLTKDLEGLYAFSYHSPHPDLWHLRASGKAGEEANFSPRMKEEPTALAQSSTPLTQDATWLLERAYFNDERQIWCLSETPEGPSTRSWYRSSKAEWVLRRSLYVSQLRHGRFRPVKAAFEPIEKGLQAPGGEGVRFADAGLLGPEGPPPLEAGLLRVDRSYLAFGRYHRISLALMALSILLIAFRSEKRGRGRTPTNASGVVMMLLLAPTLLCTQVTCLHACLWVLWKMPNGNAFLWAETLLLLVTWWIIWWVSLRAIGPRVLECVRLHRPRFTSESRWRRVRQALTPTATLWLSGMIIPVPALLVLGGRSWEVLNPHPDDLFAPSFRTLAALEPLTGLAYLATLLTICGFLAVAIRFEGLRAFHERRNVNLMQPEVLLGTPRITLAEPRYWALACLLVPFLLYLPLGMDGAFRAVRLISSSIQVVVGWLIGGGFIALGTYAICQFWMAWRSWRVLKLRSVALEVAPWRDAYEAVGKLYSWRPTRSLGQLGTDNRVLAFKVMEECLSPLSESEVPQLREIRERLRKLADPGTGRAEEVHLVSALDRILASLLPRLAPLASAANSRLLALHTYLYFRRNFWDIKYRVYLSLAASFCLLFGGAAGLQGSQALMLLALAGIGLQLLLLLRLILDLEGNGLFSAVSGTAPGKANWNQDTWSALLRPLALALLALLIARFPGLGAAAAGLLGH